MKKSLDFSKAINQAILFDVVFKGVLLLGMILLIWFYRNDPAILAGIIALIGFSIYQLRREWIVRQELLKIEDLTQEVSSVIKRKIEFYRAHLSLLKWMLAFSPAMLVWVGSMFYYYSKYGYYKMEDAADVIVTIVMITLAFVISYVAHSYQLKYNVLELEESLEALEDQQTASGTIHRQEKRKRIFRTAMIVIAAIGILLFILFVALYFI